MRRGARRQLGAAGLALLAAGCTVGPDYVRPAVATPDAYTATQAAATSAPAALPTPWWSIYHDPQLDALVAKVAVDSQTLKAAAARQRAAQALLDSARGEQVPTVGLGTFNVGRDTQRDFGIGASWELDLWGRIRRGVEAQGAAAQASANDLAAATLSLQSQFVRGYFSLREKDALSAHLQPLVASSARWAEMVARQHAAGVAAASEVVAARVRLAQSTALLNDARIARAQIEHALAVMLGQPPEKFSLAPAPFDTPVPVIPAGVPSTLLQRRPDIAAAERRMAAANARIGVRTAEQYPSIDLVAGIGVSYGLFATPTADAPLYAGGTLRANVADARAGYDEAVANYRQTVLDAFREVEDNLVAQNLLAKTAATQAAASSAAHAAARSVANQYQAGVAGYDAMLQAQAAALDSDSASLQVRLQRLDASVRLIAATGGGWSVEPAAAASVSAPHATPDTRPPDDGP